MKVELVREIPRGSFRVALLDFDGTLSLLRRGWQDVMVDYMVEVLSEAECGREREELRKLVREYVSELTGKQTIYQMIRLAEEIRKRGREPQDPLEYKHVYHERLWDLIGGRIEALRKGLSKPEDWLVPGARSLLDELRSRGVVLYLASGTDSEYVRDEIELLGLTSYFRNEIHGALDDYRSFSKKILIRKLVERWHLKGPDFLSFGDGYVEIENTKEVGGVAVGVATEEEHCREVDTWKRERLLRAGADMILPNLLGAGPLVAYLFAETDVLGGTDDGLSTI